MPRLSDAQFDTTRPSIARVYDALLGGKDNFAVDREMAQQMIDNVPGARDAALMNRAALARAVRYLTQAGVGQFVDLGSGLPTQENVHQVAQRHLPSARVVYVDNDPIVLSHGRALLASNDTTTVIAADILEPGKVLGNSDLKELIDFSQPVAVMMCGILHHIPDSDDPKGIVARYRDMLPSGSYLFITQLCDNGSVGSAELKRIGRAQSFPGALRTLAEIGEFFAGWELVEPGVVYLPLWRPDGPVRPESMLTEHEQLHAGGLGRK
ncbi:MAG: SAM-dependent methyltransferase [Micromonosporaceae bacterium]